jgi:2-polyprenyl-3-methyl-5-hydroxy-6-metoxy-1,4-benzoquinol methylase
MSTGSNIAGDYEVYWSRLQESAQYHPANRFRYWLIGLRLKRYLKPGMSLLDMGCGHGGLLLRLKEDYPESRFAGCDVSRQVIGFNQSRELGIVFFEADVAAPDCIDRAAEAMGRRGFDVVVSSEVIEHVENDGSLLRNAADLLAPGGYLVLTTQSGPRYRVDLELLHHLRHYDRGALEQMVLSAGLEIVESFNCGFPVLTLQKIVANAMFDTVIRSAASSRRPSALVRLIMNIMFVLMKIAPKWSGPQIVIVARRPPAA